MDPPPPYISNYRDIIYKWLPSTYAIMYSILFLTSIIHGLDDYDPLINIIVATGVPWYLIHILGDFLSNNLKYLPSVGYLIIMWIDI